MDGYRRLERTRSAAGAALGAASVEARVRRSPRLTRARVAGAMRLVGFVGVLALIVGTSVSLASADERSAPVQRAAAKPATTAKPAVSAPDTASSTVTVSEIRSREGAAPKADAAPKIEAAEEVADAAAEPDAVAVDATATAGTASGATPQAALPLTGDVQVRWLLLGGAVLVLVGMLVQVAGQPLPAHARPRS